MAPVPALPPQVAPGAVPALMQDCPDPRDALPDDLEGGQLGGGQAPSAAAAEAAAAGSTVPGQHDGGAGQRRHHRERLDEARQQAHVAAVHCQVQRAADYNASLATPHMRALH